MMRRLHAPATFLLLLALWVPLLHLGFAPRDVPAARRELGRALLAQQRATLASEATRRASRERMRRANPEWDFMGRTFLALALANDALADGANAQANLSSIDAILEETLALEAEHGQEVFLLPYGQGRPFVQQPARSVFVDGELALVLAARQAVAREPRWEEPLRARVMAIEQRLEASPAFVLESYPDEGWTFCHAMALAALRLSDLSTGEDHRPLLRRWVAHARAHLVDRETGLLVSSFRYDGTHLDGPEGSTIFLSAHLLAIVDEGFAREQYDRAKRELGHEALGFGWASEWPASWRGPTDVDSGPIVPLLDASAGASGMAVLGAARFGDDAWLAALLASLELAAFPIRSGSGLRYAASNQVGDAVLLYAMVEGPLFARFDAPSAPVARRDGVR